MDAGVVLAKNSVNIKYEDIDTDTLEVTKKHILDMLAVIVAGSTALGCKEVVELTKEWGGKKESSILAYGGRVPAPNAAQANAVMGHALDYDDCFEPAGHHSGVTVIPACFAVAEQKGKVDGKQFLTAIALGIDLSCRMALAQKTTTDIWGDGWWNTQLYGFFATAAATGRILGLDEEAMVNAFGIAYQQASGNIQCVYDGALTKRMGPSFAARGGLLSALLAQRGITGAQNSLEGVIGLYNLYHGQNYDRGALVKNLGKRFEGANISLKPYPCCRLNHPFIDAVLALKSEHALKAEDVAEVTVFAGQSGFSLNCEPLSVKRNPKTIVDAQFSILWSVAAAIVWGKLSINHFTPEAIKDPVVLQTAQKVTPKLDDSLSRGGLAIEPAVVNVRTNDGRVLSKRVDFPLGNPQNPMSWELITSKLEECAAYAAQPIPKANLKKVIDMVMKMEEVKDVGEIVKLLS